MANRFLHTAGVIASMTTISLLSRATAAQQPDIDAEYKAALAARDAGNYSVACPKLDEIVRLRAAGAADQTKGLGARLELAACYESQGKLASAVEQYALVQTLAAGAGQKDREEKARVKLAALQPKVALVTIVVPPSVAALPEVSVSLDQKSVDKKYWGTPMPVDPGKHSITVTASGRSAWQGQGDVPANGTRVSIEVQAPVLPPAAPPRDLAPRPPPAAPPPAERPLEPSRAEGQRRWQRPFAYGVFGLGAVGVGVGIGLAVDAAGKLDASRPHCKAGTGSAPDICNDAGVNLRAAGRVSADISTVTTIAGGVLMAGGLVVWLTAPSESKVGASTEASLVPTHGGCLATLQQEW